MPNLFPPDHEPFVAQQEASGLGLTINSYVGNFAHADNIRMVATTVETLEAKGWASFKPKRRKIKKGCIHSGS